MRISSDTSMLARSAFASTSSGSQRSWSSVMNGAPSLLDAGPRDELARVGGRVERRPSARAAPVPQMARIPCQRPSVTQPQMAVDERSPGCEHVGHPRRAARAAVPAAVSAPAPTASSGAGTARAEPVGDSASQR